MRSFPNLPEHLRRTRLVEPGPGVGQPHGFQQPGHTEGCELAGQDWLLPARRHEALGRQVVHLVRFAVSDDRGERVLIQEVGGHDGDAVDEMLDPLVRVVRRAPDHPDHLVALLQEDLSQIGAILACYPRD